MDSVCQEKDIFWNQITDIDKVYFHKGQWVKLFILFDFVTLKTDRNSGKINTTLFVYTTNLPDIFVGVIQAF